MNYRINNFIDDFCDNNDVTPTELLSKYRKRELVEKRMVLSYFLKIKFDLTFDKIATIMNRTHASIIHYIKRLGTVGDPRQRRSITGVADRTLLGSRKSGQIV